MFCFAAFMMTFISTERSPYRSAAEELAAQVQMLQMSTDNGSLDTVCLNIAYRL